jgi:hypothetical protein
MKLTKLSQTMGEPQAKRNRPPRNNGAIAEALVNAASSLGLDAFAIQTGEENGFTSFSVICNGKRMRMAQAGMGERSDIQITFDVPYTGNMVGKVMHGMESGPADHVMRQIVAHAVKGSGIAAQQVEREVNPELCMNPDAYAAPGGQVQAPGMTQMGVQPNGMA